MIARHDRAAIKHNARDIHPRQSHACRRNCFITGHQNNNAVKAMALHGQFNRVRNHFAGHERSAHPLTAHCDAVGNRNRVKIDWRTARCANTRANRNSELIKVHVTGTHIGPCIENRNHRAFKILVIHTCGTEHSARGSTAWTFDDCITSFCHTLTL